nr:MAG TPA: hypothetical protein [Caudoviricetes sp.]DAS38250.1 MAG TPA: hypothetical protein [Bacteriophage sp.]
MSIRTLRSANTRTRVNYNSPLVLNQLTKLNIRIYDTLVNLPY